MPRLEAQDLLQEDQLQSLRQCRICLESANICNVKNDNASMWSLRWWRVWPSRCKAWMWAFVPQRGSELEHEHGPNAPESWVSPCRCKGTQRWVHVTCLRAWQRACMKNKSLYKATTCSVCKACYSLAPPSEPFLSTLWQRVKGCRPVLVIGPALFTVPILLIMQIVLASLVFATVLSFVKNMFQQKTAVHPTPRPAIPVPPLLNLRAEAQLAPQRTETPQYRARQRLPRIMNSRGENSQQQQQQQQHREVLRDAQAVAAAPRLSPEEERLQRVRRLQPQDAGRTSASAWRTPEFRQRRELRPGCLLRATEANAAFAGALVLLEHCDASRGARGVIVNRALSESTVGPARHLSRVMTEAGVWLGRGGPHINNVVTVLHEDPGLPGSTRLSGGICLGHYTTLRHLEIQAAESDLRNARLKIIFGSARWEGAELEEELCRGLWAISAPAASADELFARTQLVRDP